MAATSRFAVSFPERLPMRWCLAGATALLVGQVVTGTSLLHAELVFVFVALSSWTVNLAGGLTRLGGFCVAMMSLKIVVISQVAKVLMGEAGDDRLTMPTRTMLVLIVGLMSMAVAVWGARPLMPQRPLFRADLSPEGLRLAGGITFLLGAVGHIGVLLTGMDDGVLTVGGVPGLLRQWTFCLSLAVAFTTAHVILASGGSKLFGVLNVLPAGFSFALGVLAASKQGMFEPVLIIALTAVAFQFRFSVGHLLSMGLLMVLALGVLFPFGQVARNYTRGHGFVGTVETTVEFVIKHLLSVEGFRQMYGQYADAKEESDLTRYYEQSMGPLERVSLIKMVDLLVTATEREGRSEWETITHGFKMVLPRFLYPHKPAINTGTYLGKKARVISDDDWGTQISFGFIADAYSAFAWSGVALIPGLIAWCFLLVFNGLVGPLERNVWSVYLFAEFQHFFAEQTISAMTLTVLRRPIWLITAYVLVRGGIFLWRVVDGSIGSGSTRALPNNLVETNVRCVR